MPLDTGRRLHRYQWTELSMGVYALNRVEYIANQEEQPLVAKIF